jgi:hypothetical protein
VWGIFVIFTPGKFLNRLGYGLIKIEKKDMMVLMVRLTLASIVEPLGATGVQP